MARTPVTAFQAVITTGTVSIAFLALMWSFNSESERKYLAKSEHAIYADHVESQIKGLEEHRKEALTKEAFNNWKEERDRRIAKIEADIQSILMTSRSGVTAHDLEGLQRQLDAMKELIKELAAREDARHIGAGEHR